SRLGQAIVLCNLRFCLCRQLSPKNWVQWTRVTVLKESQSLQEFRAFGVVSWFHIVWWKENHEVPRITKMRTRHRAQLARHYSIIYSEMHRVNPMLPLVTGRG